MTTHVTTRRVLAFTLIFWAVFLMVLGICEISFPDLFSWSEILSDTFPKLYRYSLWIGTAECLLAALLLWPSVIMDRNFSIRAIETLLRLGLGGMFIFASWFKIASPKEFAVLVAQYQFLPHDLINPFALLMPQLEFWTGLALILTPYTRENALMLLCMFLSFIIALSYALWHDLGIVCGCFAIAGAQDKSETWTSLIRDIILLVPTAWLVTRPRKTLWQIWKS